eukprot:jgi/Picsp_1/1886/NSC_05352-R1_violaxanthin de-epoxidase
MASSGTKVLHRGAVAVIIAVLACRPCLSTPSPEQASAFEADASCLLSGCEVEMTKCFDDAQCQEMLQCLITCGSDQKCAFTCFYVGNLSKASKDLLRCIEEEGCIKSPESQDECETPPVSTGVEGFELQDFVGEWYVVRGLSPQYDCWDCQRMRFGQLADSVLDYAYDVKPAANRTSVTFDCSVIPVNGTSSLFSVPYSFQDAIKGVDTWYVLDRNEDGTAVLIYYCGENDMLKSWYRGAIVMSTTRKVSDETLKQFDLTLSNSGLGISLDDFCENSLAACEF